ncbi:hypothetical protein NE236_41345 [Actinoallomurus purpureus]|uniref:phage tail termination protein n=1 Tax=Actinoallomurus purpureus TaxID=478114 RepID=UPI002092C449|nr:hypothetical protein [Actinoallomurus purpureus]MCO6011415.1 hypothetical protein [Actinoallomurus purpureus]
MPELGPFPDVERAVMDLLADLVTDPADVGTRIPADLQTRLGAGRKVIRVRCIGGDDDRFTDYPRVDVEVYASTRAVAMPLAETIRQRLISRPRQTAFGVIDRATTEVRPQEISYDDPDVRMVTATYRMSLRRRVP